jgi:hypothetical protein
MLGILAGVSLAALV